MGTVEGHRGTLTGGWLFREPPSGRNIMSKYKIIKNLADTSFKKMKHPNSIENTRTKENEKLVFFFQTLTAGCSLLFILASDFLFGSKLIWVVIPIGSLLSG